VRLEGLPQLKNPMTSSGIQHATFRLIAQCNKKEGMGLVCRKDDSFFFALQDYLTRLKPEGPGMFLHERRGKFLHIGLYISHKLKMRQF
jgi:hypothetical protein